MKINKHMDDIEFSQANLGKDSLDDLGFASEQELEDVLLSLMAKMPDR